MYVYDGVNNKLAYFLELKYKSERLFEILYISKIKERTSLCIILKH